MNEKKKTWLKEEKYVLDVISKVGPQILIINKIENIFHI